VYVYTFGFINNVHYYRKNNKKKKLLSNFIFFEKNWPLSRFYFNCADFLLLIFLFYVNVYNTVLNIFNYSPICVSSKVLVEFAMSFGIKLSLFLLVYARLNSIWYWLFFAFEYFKNFIKINSTTLFSKIIFEVFHHFVSFIYEISYLVGVII
jgi:hypothetical protein